MAKDLKARLAKRKKELSEKGGGGNVIYFKEGTTRIRLLPVTEDELGQEVTNFYLGDKIKGVYCPSTFGDDSPMMEAYQELKNSKDDEEQELAKKLSPKKAFVHPVVLYDDDKGKKINMEKSGQLAKFPNGVYQSIIDLYLDEDEWGDMTDPKKGYDIKIIRTGKGQYDTEYSVAPCKNSPLAEKKFHKPVDLEKLVRGLMEPYDELQDKVNQFLGVDSDDDDDSPKKSKKKKKSSDDFSEGKKKMKKGLKKNLKSDDDEDEKPKKKLKKKLKKK